MFVRALDKIALEEVAALCKVLDVPAPTGSADGLAPLQLKLQLWKQLSYFGSNDIAYLVRGLEGVAYPEILRDVCDKLGVAPYPGESEQAVVANEQRLLQKFFEQVWEQMSEDERKELMRSMNMATFDVHVGGAAAAAAIATGWVSGFGAYKLAVIVANFIARALLGRGLTFAANAALTRALGLVLGPVGWIASGAWLVADIASPAARKTVPAVLQVAALRQISASREVIGVVGRGAVGKDSLLFHAFGIDTRKVSPIPGSTSAVEVYSGLDERARILNFPGFRDLRVQVREEIEQQLNNCSLIVYLVDGARVVQQEEVERYAQIWQLAHRQNAGLIVLFNFMDQVEPESIGEFVEANRARLGVPDPILISLKGRTLDRKWKASMALLKSRVDEWFTGRGRLPVFTQPASNVSPEPGSTGQATT